MYEDDNINDKKKYLKKVQKMKNKVNWKKF